MAQEGMSPSTFTAGAALTKHRFFKLDTTADRTALAAGAGEQTFGVTREDAASGAFCPCDHAAGARVKLEVDGSGTAIAAGDYLKADANAKGVKSTVDQENVGAIALEASSADGDIIEVALLAPGTERSTV